MLEEYNLGDKGALLVRGRKINAYNSETTYFSGDDEVSHVVRERVSIFNSQTCEAKIFRFEADSQELVTACAPGSTINFNPKVKATYEYVLIGSPGKEKLARYQTDITSIRCLRLRID